MSMDRSTHSSIWTTASLGGFIAVVVSSVSGKDIRQGNMLMLCISHAPHANVVNIVNLGCPDSSSAGGGVSELERPKDNASYSP